MKKVVFLLLVMILAACSAKVTPVESTVQQPEVQVSASPTIEAVTQQAQIAPPTQMNGSYFVSSGCFFYG